MFRCTPIFQAFVSEPLTKENLSIGSNEENIEDALEVAFAALNHGSPFETSAFQVSGLPSMSAGDAFRVIDDSTGEVSWWLVAAVGFHRSTFEAVEEIGRAPMWDRAWIVRCVTKGVNP